MPGLGAVVVGVAVSYGLNLLVPVVSPLMFAIVLGVLFANVGLYRPALRPGVTWATKKLLRLGVVLLGLQLAIPDVLALGWQTLVVVVVTVLATFFGTQWLGRKFGMSRTGALLTATGLSICGASAVAAMDEVAHGDEDETATAVALVTIFGSLAIVVLPLLRAPLHMPMEMFGAWSGASVHEVAQVVATAGAAGSAAVGPAVLVKLSRVVLLAPMVIGASLVRRRQARTAGPAATDGDGATRLPPIVPLFVIGFLVAVAVRSVGILPTAVLDGAKTATTLLLCAALFGLGTGVNVRGLVRTGGRALAVGALSMVLIAAISYAGLTLVG
jgi:uncharacterized integral membrane protein (TIGR00698 family)